MAPRRGGLPGLAPFRIRDFAAYWTSSATTQVAGAMEMTTSSWLIYDLTGSPILLGLNGIFRAVPTIALALLGGALADRGSRKALLQVAQLALLATALALAALVASGAVAFWHFYAASAVIASVGAFSQPSRMALYPNLVPREQLQNAVTLNSIPHRISILVGPAVAGVILARAGGGSAYIAVALLQVVAFVLLALVRVPAARGAPPSSLLQLAIGGIRYSFGHGILRALLLLELVLLLFSHGATLLTVFARDVLRAGPEGLGLLYGAAGAGSFLASIGLIVVGDVQRKGRVLFFAAGAYVLALLGFASSNVLALSLALMFLVGAAESVWSAMRQSIIQFVIQDAYRGRVMSLMVIGWNGVTQLGQLQAGFLVALVGAPIAASVGALAIGAGVVSVWLRRPQLRGFSGAQREPLGEPRIEGSAPTP